MKIALAEGRRRVAVLDAAGVRLFDIGTGVARLVASRPLVSGWCLSACDAYVAVLVGDESPSGVAVENAKLLKFTWELEPLGAIPLGTVRAQSPALDAGGERVAFADYAAFEIAVADASNGQRLAGEAASFPTGLSLSPDGARLLVGVTGQGGGAILLGDVAGGAGGKLSTAALRHVEPVPWLADASFFTAFGRGGRLAVATNENWGGRGIFVYDVEAVEPLWNRVLESETEETDDWHAFAAAFASRDALLLAAGPRGVRGYRARDGEELGAIELPGDGRAGFVVEQDARRVWVPGESPTAHPFPDTWA